MSTYRNESQSVFVHVSEGGEKNRMQMDSSERWPPKRGRVFKMKQNGVQPPEHVSIFLARYLPSRKIIGPNSSGRLYPFSTQTITATHATPHSKQSPPPSSSSHPTAARFEPIHSLSNRRASKVMQNDITTLSAHHPGG